jgi:hypothetical protein
MAKRSPAQVYRDLRAAGFGPAQALTMTAIAGAESGWRVDARGDVSLQDDTWGPSYGLYQVRTLKAETGTGRPRDLVALTDPQHQAAAAYAISRGGRDFSPWTVYRTGAYREFLAAAGEAARGAGELVGGLVDAATGAAGELAGDVAGGGLVERALSGVRGLVLQGLVVALGAALVAAGAWRASHPARRRVRAVVGL